MKTIITLIMIATLLSYRCTEKEVINAEVISINEQILEGKLIGNFLSSPSGFLSNDIIKVGVRFKFKKFDKIVYADLKLQHSELVEYKNSNILPLYVIYKKDPCGCKGGNLIIYLSGRKVYTERWDPDKY